MNHDSVSSTAMRNSAQAGSNFSFRCSSFNPPSSVRQECHRHPPECQQPQSQKEVEQGRFREDLYYRLKVFSLYTPALRERRSDILLLAERFLQGAQENAARTGLKLTEENLRTLVAYDWPGNVRKLESAIEYAAWHAHGTEIQPVDLPPELQGGEVQAASQRSPLAALFDDLPTLDELEQRYLLHALAVVGGSKTKTAAVMGIDRRTLYRMTERFKIILTEGEDDSLSA
jgi:DNA-binding NtrC family response regulator